ncbi:helix-turn-helix domain-containing protein [Clostridium sp. MCC353]|uniref:helix-turn-helix domain-containing protein n=1 Tax=Clostridium sp. MCC353 TaxID=2592646 RepID=UPI001C023AF6|nr:helix-turn-helix transcriptional regulator [Clostridium sp. MCC353]MBT9776692.1 helix-turn-helix domain-containing protein [Clostridium sp. MCC353]
MKIGEVIRKYRKEKQLTQEQMANCLGVTAPAVNKWENGNAYPDITLLAPIARLLGISTDLLLSYREELTDKEITGMAACLGEKLRKEAYGQAFSWAEERILEYPNCDKLILTMAQILDSYRYIVKAADAETYDGRIHGFYVRALNSKDQEIAQAAAAALFYFCLSKEEFDTAQEYLDQIQERTVNPDRLQAVLYQRQGKTEEAYERYERLLFSSYGDINWALNGIHTLALEEHDVDKAEKMAEKQRQLAELLEMGKYMEVSPGLDLAVLKQDKEAAIQIMTDLVHNIKHVDGFRNSKLYEHMSFSNSGKKNFAFMLLKELEEEESIDFIKDDRRYKMLMRELKNMAEE